MKTVIQREIEQMQTKVQAFYDVLDTWEPRAKARALKCFCAYLADVCIHETPCLECKVEGVDLILQEELEGP